MDVDLPYLSRERDRHKNWRIYVRRNGRRVRIKEPTGTPEFLTAYQAALDALGDPVASAKGRKKIPPKGTLGWLAAQYFACPKFMNLDPVSRRNRRAIIEVVLREPPNPNSKHTMAFFDLRKLTTNVVQVLVDRISAKPGAANNRKKYLSAMLSWGARQGHLRSNPARDAERIEYATDGFHTWTVDEVQKFEKRHPIGTKARLALALLLYLGVRRGDVIKLGKQHVRDGWIRFVPKKTLYKRKRLSEKPVLPVLADIIAASPTGDLTFLVTAYGNAFTAAGFGGWFRDRCDEADLHHCTAHGLRKAGATLAAQNGATDRQLMAMFDWTSASQATTYTATADRKRLAGEAGKLMADGDKT
jgi:integrase